MIPLEEFHAVVVDALKVVQKNDEISLSVDESFTDFGIDSLDSMSLLLELEKRLSIEFDEEFDLFEHDSVAKLHASLAE
ncbi:MAG: acyl carrier protein [gamma proteobacterium endosymbiont of Lamellibrachia anaximandri]|nr:acyl carrier protein [gamma proteobacterium endosymbiont of Lamellibrachia anaximandri]MBL3532326.1 acyl carrier protein [gamma proteobacterium endosymbiont of Lamellibrachia anaximandri]